MLRRHSACGAAGAVAAEPACAPFPGLPQPLALRVLALLPADSRARAACVARGWRDAVADPALWLRLDLSPESGVPPALVTGALLVGAAARARGQLEALDMAEYHDRYDVAHACRGVVAANAGSLRELRVFSSGDARTFLPTWDSLQALLEAAPQLRVLEADVRCSTMAEALLLLRNETAPLAHVQLRLRKLRVQAAADEAEDADALMQIAAAVAAHASLEELRLVEAPLELAGTLDAVVDAALTQRLQTILLIGGYIAAASAPALARLLAGGALRTLVIDNSDSALLDAAAAAALGSALRANGTLSSLTLVACRLWEEPEEGNALVLALTGHPRLRELVISESMVTPPSAGNAFGALIAANTPVLQSLDIRTCHIGEAGLRPLFEALPRNTHLRALHCSAAGARAACTRQVLLPAVRANTSLQELRFSFFGVADLELFRELQEAQDVVEQRAAQQRRLP
jgi:hypothetical protein